MPRKRESSPAGTAKVISPAQANIQAAAQDLDLNAFFEKYERNQVLLVKGCQQAAEAGKPERAPFCFKDCQDLYAEYPKVITRAFHVEQAPGGKDGKKPAPEAVAKRLLGSRGRPRGPWYSSFVVQRNRQALAKFWKRLPFKLPPFLRGKVRRKGVEREVKHSEAAWVFFGQNPDGRAMAGRKEHTDVIAHGGTWHLQLQGSKVWFLRPTDELLRKNRSLRDIGRIKVVCQPGDVLCVNTRLWWHRTQIPGSCPSSISVARDMYLDGTTPHAPDFTNVKGHYATSVFEKGAIVFTADEAPDLELPQSKQSNCTLADLDGEMALVAKRRIKPGEWFSISESEDEAEEPRPSKRRRRA